MRSGSLLYELEIFLCILLGAGCSSQTPLEAWVGEYEVTPEERLEVCVNSDGDQITERHVREIYRKFKVRIGSEPQAYFQSSDSTSGIPAKTLSHKQAVFAKVSDGQHHPPANLDPGESVGATPEIRQQAQTSVVLNAVDLKYKKELWKFGNDKYLEEILPAECNRGTKTVLIGTYRKLNDGDHPCDEDRGDFAVCWFPDPTTVSPD